ncbi:MAG: hypothetical protein EXR95_06805 [Gemmatimonadetes bacterium]|nr:hypothetical protein [Gemmatimonadota bacterium]
MGTCASRWCGGGVNPRRWSAISRPGRGARGAVACSLALLFIPACGGDDAPPPPSGAVSSATPEATAAGIRVLALGGNAVDAAVAISLALGASEPSESGLGGAVVMLIAPAAGDPVVIHAEPEALASDGPGSQILRPTALPVLVQAWRKYGSGKLSWEELVEPARRIAERGYTLGRFRHRMLVSEYRRLLSDSVASALFLNADRSIPGEGTVVTMPALDGTLEQLAETAPDDLPGGPTATALVAEVARSVDSAAARALSSPATVREDRPLSGSYRGWTVLTPGEPYAGRGVLRALELLANAPVDALRRPNEVRTAWVAEALGYAAASSGAGLSEYVAGMPPLPIAFDTTRPAAGAIIRPAPPAGTGAAAVEGAPPAPALAPDPAGGAPLPDTAGAGEETSHFSVVDAAGMAVAVTQTLGGPFGARATRLGYLLGRAPARPTPPPPTDTVGVGRAAIAAQAALPVDSDPWEEQIRWAVPTVLVRDGIPGLVLGSAGGPRALSAVVQVITDWVDGGRPLERAVAAPRVHVTRDALPRPSLALEGVSWMTLGTDAQTVLAPWGKDVRLMAAQRGLRLGEWMTGLEYMGLSPFFGGVQAVARENEAWIGAADPRRDGVGRPLTDEDVLRAQQGADEGEATATDEPALPPVRPPSRSPE